MQLFAVQKLASGTRKGYGAAREALATEDMLARFLGVNQRADILGGAWQEMYNTRINTSAIHR